MSGPATADGFVAGIGHAAGGIAGHHPADSAKVLEDRLEAPEASAAQRGRFLRHTHVYLPLGDLIIYALSPSVTPAPGRSAFSRHPRPPSIGANRHAVGQECPRDFHLVISSIC